MTSIVAVSRQVRHAKIDSPRRGPAPNDRRGLNIGSTRSGRIRIGELTRLRSAGRTELSCFCEPQVARSTGPRTQRSSQHRDQRARLRNGSSSTSRTSASSLRSATRHRRDFNAHLRHASPPLRLALPDGLLRRCLRLASRCRRRRAGLQPLDLLDRPVEIAGRLRGLQPPALGVVLLELGVGVLLGQLVRDRARVGQDVALVELQEGVEPLAPSRPCASASGAGPGPRRSRGTWSRCG